MREYSVVTLSSHSPDTERGNSRTYGPPLLRDGVSTKELRHSKKRGKTAFSIFGQDLSYLPDGLKLIICSAGVFIFYLIYGYMQVRGFLFCF